MTKNQFIQSIAMMHEQHQSDLDYAKNVGEAMGIELNPYNNSRLVNSLVNLLSQKFHDPEEAKAEINRFMYEENFGRIDKNKSRNNHRNYENLWNRLNMPWVKQHNIYNQEGQLIGFIGMDPFGNQDYEKKM